MAARGLSYIPYVPPQPTIGWLNPTEYAAQYGFGIVKRPPESIYSLSDPNQEYIARLPPTDHRRYVDALFVSPTFGVYGGGCMGEANASIRGLRDSLLLALNADVVVLREQVHNDPRVRQAGAVWVQCMADAGFEVKSREALELAIYEEISRPYESLRPGLATEQAALAARERLMAMTSIGCDVDFMRVSDRVSVGLETMYVHSNLAVLERLKAEAYPTP